MFSRVILAAASLLALAGAEGASAQPITAAELRRHIDVLASDAFQGRQPATEGEQLTTSYIVRELTQRGIEPAGVDGSWFQPVTLVERSNPRHEARWSANGRPIAVPAEALVVSSRDAEARTDNAPVIFAGHGAVIPDMGIDQLAGVDVRGAVVLIMYEGPEVQGFPSFSQRVEGLARAGAAAVIGIVSPDLPFDQVRAAASRSAVRLEGELPAAYGAMSWDGAVALVRGGGQDLERLLNDQPGSSFRSVTLPINATLQASATVRRFTTNNVVGRLRGAGTTGQSVLLLGHWDHLGICRPEGEADRICNGAVDNASGIAMLIETMGRLAQGERPQRDILILATTAEEDGLLGAEHFGRNPVVPRESIVAALNVDTAAIAPAGMPVAVMGGTPAMERVIGRVALAIGRRLDPDREADALATRQDGWALTRNGIPTAMAGGSFSDMSLLGAFLSGHYHQPGDAPSAELELAGAAEDADLLVALARAFANPSEYASPDAPTP